MQEKGVAIFEGCLPGITFPRGFFWGGPPPKKGPSWLYTPYIFLPQNFSPSNDSRLPRVGRVPLGKAYVLV